MNEILRNQKRHSIRPDDCPEMLSQIKEHMLLNALADYGHSELLPNVRYAVAFKFEEVPAFGYEHAYDTLAPKRIDIELTIDFVPLPEVAIVEKGELTLIKVTEPI